MKPAMTVIMPTHNRAAVLGETLAAFVESCRAESSWELLVADNNSTDDTAARVGEYADSLPVRYLFEPRQGKNHAILAALEAAQGELLIFVDDDISPSPGWLSAYAAAALQWPEHVAFGGPVISRPPEGTLSEERLAAIEAVVGVGHFNPACPAGPLPADSFPVGANFMLRRSAFGDGGLTLDPAIGPCGRGRIAGSETALFSQLHSAGRRIVYVPEAKATHRTDPAFWRSSTLRRRAFAQGRGAARIKSGGIGMQTAMLSGAPRYLYRIALGRLAESVWRMICGQTSRALTAWLLACRCWGMVVEYRRISRTGGVESPLDGVSSMC